VPENAKNLCSLTATLTQAEITSMDQKLHDLGPAQANLSAFSIPYGDSLGLPAQRNPNCKQAQELSQFDSPRFNSAEACADLARARDNCGIRLSDHRNLVGRECISTSP
jgi:hypothetical protein